MPRTRNKETERAILAAVWKLFCEQGCNGASYTEIAELSGVPRPLVQRYFPTKKSMISACVTAIRNASVAVCDTAVSKRLHPLERLYVRGQVNLATYFASAGVRRFMTDVFASRELTHSVIDDGFAWTVAETLPDYASVLEDDKPDEIVISTGGLYELLYLCLLQGRRPDFARIAFVATAAFGQVFDVPLPARAKSYESWLGKSAFDQDELEQLAKKALRRVPKELVG